MLTQWGIHQWVTVTYHLCAKIHVGKPSSSHQSQWIIFSRQTQTSTQTGIRIWRIFTCDIVFYPVVSSSCWPPVPILYHFLPLFLFCRLFCWQVIIQLHVLMLTSSSLQPPPPSPPAGASTIGLREDLHAPGGRFGRLIFLDLKLLRPAVSQCCSLQIKCHITEFVIQDGCSVHNIPHHFQQCCNIALLFMCSTFSCPKAFSAPSGASNPELIPSHRLWFHDLIFGVLPFCHWNTAMLRLMLQMLKKIKIYLKKKAPHPNGIHGHSWNVICLILLSEVPKAFFCFWCSSVSFCSCVWLHV